VDVELPVVRRRVAAAGIAASVGTRARTWHLQEPAMITVRDLAAAAGGGEPLPPDRWLRRLEGAVAMDPEHPLATYVELLRSSRDGGALDPAGPRGAQLDGAASWRALHDLGVTLDRDAGAVLAGLA
jgi:hypothetical protein